MKRIMMLAALVLSLVASPSSSAEIGIDPARKNAGIATLLLKGPIQKGDSGELRAIYESVIAKPHSKWNGVAAFILNIDSGGGDVQEAMAVGRFLRDKFFMTQVVGRCDSACVFVLVSGTQRNMIAGTRLGLHRPRFADNATYAALPADQAKRRYDALVGGLRSYFLGMGGTAEAFRLMMGTSSTSVRWIDRDKAEVFGLVGNDPSWDELTDARFIEQYGRSRWLIIKPCVQRSGDFQACIDRAYRTHP